MQYTKGQHVRLTNDVFNDGGDEELLAHAGTIVEVVGPSIRIGDDGALDVRPIGGGEFAADMFGVRADEVEAVESGTKRRGGAEKMNQKARLTREIRVESETPFVADSGSVVTILSRHVGPGADTFRVSDSEGREFRVLRDQFEVFPEDPSDYRKRKKLEEENEPDLPTYGRG